MKPLSDCIIVAPIPAPKKTAGGIHLPDGSESFADTIGFIALEVAPKVKEVKPGDQVIFQSYHEAPVDVGDGRKIIREKNVLLVIPQQPPQENVPQELHE